MLNGTPDQPPTRLNMPIADVMSSLLIANGVLAALHERERTGRGQKVEVALIDALVHALANALGNYFINGWVIPRTGNRSPYFAPSGIYSSGDGGLVFVSCPTDKFFRNLCNALDTGWLDDARFETGEARLANEDALDAELSAICGSMDLQPLMERFINHDVMASPVNSVPELAGDPQVLHNQMLVETKHPTLGPTKVTGLPIRLGVTPGAVHRAPPLLGQHSLEVLGDLGYTALELDTLCKEGVTFQPDH
jgi:crotonobetainyl-CoA:carnitine CoA-transferase CaiB-like acyl-CoA transferase